MWQKDSPTPLRVYLRLSFRLEGKPISAIEDVDWEAFDEAVVEYSQVQKILIGECTFSNFRSDLWSCFNAADTQFIQDNLPRLSAAGRISFIRTASLWDPSRWQNGMPYRSRNLPVSG